MIIQSNDMGVQSFAMYFMSSMGMIPRFDYSIFVDLGSEKPRTYEMIELDEKIRDASKKGVKEFIYLHRSGKPLKDADIGYDQGDLFDTDNCDEGVCHI